MRSPRITRVEKPRTTTRSPKAFDTSSASNTSLPAASAASTVRRTVPAWARRAARSARISISRFTRPSSRVRRALMPRRSHTSSSASFLSNFSLASASLASQASFLLEERRVVARPRRQAAAIEFDDARGQPLEKRAVVGDEEDRAGVLGQERLEPLDGLDVEVVGGLVEQQHVRGRHQCAGEQHAAAPAARQRVDRCVGGQPQPRQHQLDALLEPPAVALLELVLQSAHLLERRRVAVRHLDRGVMVGGDEGAQFAQPLGDDVEDGVVGVERHVLHQPRHLQCPARATPRRDRAAARR